MSGKLDKILINAGKKGWENKLEILRHKLFKAAYFDSGDKRNEQLINIIEQVKRKKDRALRLFTKKFDGVSISPGQFRIKRWEVKKAHGIVDKELLWAIRHAIFNVRRYQKRIFLTKKKKLFLGTGIKYNSIESVGICVPAASAPLPSTVIMTAIAAQVAGVKRIAVVSPPRYNGSIHPIIIATCAELGVKEIYRVGGAQAVAALAYGTETIKPVDKIVGPGNAWVQMAKRAVFGIVDIDSIAGPSEVLIIANNKANPAFVAADLLSQAEHAPGSALLFTDSAKLVKDVLGELEAQLAKLDRCEQTLKSLVDFCAIAVFDNIEQCIRQANKFAPEHLEIQCGSRSKKIEYKITNAGAIFIGDYSPVAVGDYMAGPSHTLPTAGSARFFSALTSNDFEKSISIINYDKRRLAKKSDYIIKLAETEGLDAHAKSIRIRQ